MVEYCATHHNHDHELAHLPIPKEVAMEISYKLQKGIAMDKILDDIRDEGGTVTVGRQHLINKQDITNIKRKLNIDGIQRHENDHFSVCAWVQEMEQIDYNPVTLFKAQGVEGNGKLKKEDFIIGIQTEFQKDLMGGNIICMDATHGTNVYDFQLITVLVVDSLGEGIPVAWAISNSEDGLQVEHRQQGEHRENIENREHTDNRENTENR